MDKAFIDIDYLPLIIKKYWVSRTSWLAERTHFRALAIFFGALRCERAADYKMAAYNHPLLGLEEILLSNMATFA